MTTYYFQTADLELTEAEAEKMKKKITKACNCYVMICNEKGEEI